MPIDFQPQIDFQPAGAPQIPGMEKLGGSLPQMPAAPLPGGLDFQPAPQAAPVKQLPTTFTGAPADPGNPASVRLPSGHEAAAIADENTAQFMRAVTGQNGVGAMPAAPPVERQYSPTDDVTAPYRVLKGTAKNVADFVHDSIAGEVGTVAGGLTGNRKQFEEGRKQQAQAVSKPLVPLDQISPEPGLENGIWQGISSLSTPENLAIMGATGGVGAAARGAASPAIRAGWQAFNTALSSYFALNAGKGAVEGVKQAADDYARGDYDSMAQHLGFSGVNAMMGAVAGKHAVDSTIDIGQQSVQGAREGKAYAAARDKAQADLNAQERARRASDAQASRDRVPKLAAAADIDFRPAEEPGAGVESAPATQEGPASTPSPAKENTASAPADDEKISANGTQSKSGEAVRSSESKPSAAASPAAAAAGANDDAAGPAKADAEGDLRAAAGKPKEGDTRDIGHGPEQLTRVSLKSIVTPPPPEWRPEGNIIYPDRVAEYVTGQRENKPVELRPYEEGTWEIHDGNHRVEAARQRGEKDILAWTPAEAPAAASSESEAAKPARQTEPSGQKPASQLAQEPETQAAPPEISAPPAKKGPQLGDTRDIGHGTETLESIPLEKVFPAPPPPGRPQGNIVYPDRVEEYRSGARTPAPVELRKERNGEYTTWEGHHRVAAAKLRGESHILAWTLEGKPQRLEEAEPEETAVSNDTGQLATPGRPGFAPTEKGQPAAGGALAPRRGAAAIAGERSPELPQSGAVAAAAEAAPITPITPSAPGAALAGDAATVKTARGTKLETRYAVVPASKLVASHDTALNENPKYPAELQPRDRGRAASEAQIADIAGKLDPNELGASYQASTGAPIVGADDHVVESGNGRTIALRRLYESKHPNAQKYRDWLTAEAPKLGIKGDLSKIPDPVLVRTRAPQAGEDRPQLAREMNENAVAAMSESEQARADANHLTPELMKVFGPSEDGDVTHAGNRHFVRGFVERAIAPAERGQFQTSDGALSQAGVRRVRNAIFAKAYGGGGALERMAESPDNEIRNVTNGMVQAAGHVAALDDAIAQGKAHALSIAPEATAAAEKMAALRASGETVQDYIDQVPMFGGDLEPEARQTLALFDRYKRSPKKVGALLREYSRIVQGLGDPRQQSLTGSSTEVTARKPSKMSILRAAAERVEEEYGPASGDRQVVLGDRHEPARSGAAEETRQTPGGEREAAQRAVGQSARPAEAAAPAAEAGKRALARRRATERGSFSDKPTTPEQGPHGPVFREFRHDAAGAIAKLREVQNGEAIAALHHPEVGDIDLVWGKAGDPAKDFAGGYGLAKILAKHPEVGANLQTVISSLRRVNESRNRVVLESGQHKAVVRLEWDAARKAWLLTAYERRNPLPTGDTTEAPGSPDRSGGTAQLLPQAAEARSEPEGLAGVSGPTPDMTTPLPGGKSALPAEGRTDVPDTHAAKRQAPPLGGDSSIEPAKKEGNGTAGTKDPGFFDELLDDTRGGAAIDFLTLGARHFVNQDVLPAAKSAAATFVESRDDILKLLAPAARGAEAAATANIVRPNAAELARKGDQAQAALEKAQGYFDRRTPDDNYAFMDRIERGRPQPSIPEQAIAGIMRRLLDERRDQVRELGGGALERFYRNYFPHMWQDTERKRQVFAHDGGKSPLEGSKSFLQHRVIDTIKEGLELGLEPISSNPVDLVLAKLREMDKFIMAHKALGELGRAGMLRFTVSDKDAPEGYARVNDPVFTVRDTEGGVAGFYYLPEPAARVLNNYLAPGLQSHAWYRAIRGAGNLLNQAQLGLSAYHGVFTAFESAVSRLAAGIYAGAKGQPLRGAGLALSSPAAPFLTAMRGDKMLKEWYAPGTQGEQLGQLVDAVIQAGGRARMDARYQTHVTRSMMKAFRTGNVLGGVARAPFAAVEQAARPIMEALLPRLKMGAFADLAGVELERLGPDATLAQKRAALGRAWDSIDNRFGQLVYDNLFWDKVAKDLAMITVRSVGWNVGDIRESAGAAADAANFARGKGDFTPRMSYIPALALMAGAAGALLYYLWHGQPPQKLKDYYFPRDEHGRRWSLPNYVKDYYNWGTEPLKTARNKLHPLLTLAWEMLSNEDYFGDEIRNPNHPLVKQALEAARHVGEAFAPISARQLLEKKRHSTERDKVLPFFGLTHAPKSLDRKPFHRRHHRPAA